MCSRNYIKVRPSGGRRVWGAGGRSMDHSLHVAEHADTWARCYRRDSLRDSGTTTLRSHALCRHTGVPPPAPNQIFMVPTPRATRGTGQEVAPIFYDGTPRPATGLGVSPGIFKGATPRPEQLARRWHHIFPPNLQGHHPPTRAIGKEVAPCLHHLLVSLVLAAPWRA